MESKAVGWMEVGPLPDGMFGVFAGDVLVDGPIFTEEYALELAEEYQRQLDGSV